MQGPSCRVLRKREVLARLGGITDTTLWRWRKEGDFPEPVLLNPNARNPHVAWLEAEVDEWIASRPRGSGRAMAPDVYARNAERHRAAAGSRRVPTGRAALLPVEGRRRVPDAAQQAARVMLKPVEERHRRAEVDQRAETVEGE